MIAQKAELNSTLKATTATKCESEIESSSDKSLWSPTILGPGATKGILWNHAGWVGGRGLVGATAR